MGESTSLLSTLAGGVATVTGAITDITGVIISDSLLSLSLYFFFCGGVIGLIGRALKRR